MKEYPGVRDAGVGRTAARDVARSLRTPPIVAGAFALVLYLCCLAPTVTYGGDCGELIAASWRLGIAHPTGYALYCLGGRLFAGLVPFGEVAWRYNLFSAVCGALAIAVLAATISRLLTVTGRSCRETDAAAAQRSAAQRSAAQQSAARAPADAARWVAACGAALVLACFYYFWSQCVLAEIYATAALLLAALLYAAVSWRQSGDMRWLYSLAALFGLALNAHLSCVYLAPGLAIYCLLPCRDRLRGKVLQSAVRGTVLLLAAYSLALYLPLRSAVFPAPAGQAWAPLDWTHPAEPRNFITHVTARQYRVWLIQDRPVTLGGRTISVPQWVQKPEVTRAKLVNFLVMCTLQLGWCLPLVFVGAWASWRRERALFTLLALTVLLNIGVQIHYTVGDAPNFFFPAYMAMGVWLGLGIAAAGRRLGVRPVAAAVGCLVIVQIFIFFNMASGRGETVARDDALARADVLESVGARSGRPASVFLLSDDALWTMWYARYVLGRAPGARTPWGPDRTRHLRAGTLWQMVQMEKQRGPVLLSQFDENTDRRYPLVPVNARGDLLEATSRELPPPATPVALTVQSPDTLPVTHAEWLTDRKDGAVPLVKRSDSAAIAVTFSAPPELYRPIHVSRAEQSATAGWIQVALVVATERLDPPPNFTAKRSADVGASPLVAWREDRRLVLPYPARSAKPDRAGRINGYRAVLPINMHKDARVGRHVYWVRVVRSRDDRKTPWIKCGTVTLT